MCWVPHLIMISRLECSLLGAIGNALYESSGWSLHRPMHTNGRKTVVAVVELPFNAQIVIFRDYCTLAVHVYSFRLVVAIAVSQQLKDAFEEVMP